MDIVRIKQSREDNGFSEGARPGKELELPEDIYGGCQINKNWEKMGRGKELIRDSAEHARFILRAALQNIAKIKGLEKQT